MVPGQAAHQTCGNPTPVRTSESTQVTLRTPQMNEAPMQTVPSQMRAGTLVRMHDSTRPVTRSSIRSRILSQTLNQMLTAEASSTVVPTREM